MWSSRFRGRLLRMLGATIAADARVYPNIRFVGRMDMLSMGNRSFINVGAIVGSNSPVTIGSDVAIGPGVQMLPTTHQLGPSTRRAGTNVSAAISIGDGAWIGAGAIILSGVTVGHGAVVAAGSVVLTDCDPDCLYGGSPARLLKKFDRDSELSGQPVG